MDTTTSEATVTDLALINLRATVAMRTEDLRIASKHMREAAARNDSPANHRAYVRALGWEATCREREQEARGRLIRHNQGAAA